LSGGTKSPKRSAETERWLARKGEATTVRRGHAGGGDATRGPRQSRKAIRQDRRYLTPVRKCWRETSRGESVLETGRRCRSSQTRCGAAEVGSAFEVARRRARNGRRWSTRAAGVKIPQLRWRANPEEEEAQEGIDRRENLTVFPHGTDSRTE